MRQALRLSGVAGHMPEQLAEVLEDLRKGHLTLKSSDPVMPTSLDRLGRRLFAALSVSSLVIGGSLILAWTRGAFLILGGAMLALALVVAVAHAALDWWRALGIRR
jgi:ABC-type tungstate transport system substrate-binding protein